MSFSWSSSPRPGLNTALVALAASVTTLVVQRFMQRFSFTYSVDKQTAMQLLPQRGKLFAILGCQWGDEGKGKIATALAMSNKYAFMCRAVGGPNAGHTAVYRGKTFKFHQCPVGILNPMMTCILGNGMVIDLDRLMIELEDVAKLMEDQSDSNLFTVDAMIHRIRISHRAHLIFSCHRKMDANMETLLGDESIGTTKSGVGPCYTTKTQRIGVPFEYLAHDDFELFKNHYEHQMMMLSLMNSKELITISEEEKQKELKSLATYRSFARRVVCDCGRLINLLLSQGNHGLVEGANSPMLSFDQGIYPFVTSTETGMGGTISGLMLNLFDIGEVHGVIKMYATRVGKGPTPGKMPETLHDKVQRDGNEVGTRTGRPRDCMFLDLPQIRETIQRNGITSLSLLKLDLWTEKGDVYIGDRYTTPDGTIPSMAEDFKKYDLQLMSMPGWDEDLSKIRTWDKLPVNVQNFVLEVQRRLEVPILSVGVGKDNEALIKVPSNVNKTILV